MHDNQQLPKVEKLLRLKTLMKGEAIKLIQHLPTTENNYECAWDIVKQRFGNKRILFQTLIDKILDQPYANSSSTSSIKNLLDTSNECVQALNALGLEIEAADPIIARIIIRKLDKEGLLHYEQNTKKSKEIQVLDDVLQFLEQQYRALEAIQPKRFGTFQKHQIKTTSFLTEQHQCLYCAETSHKTYACTKLLEKSVSDRSWFFSRYSKKLICKMIDCLFFMMRCKNTLLFWHSQNII